MLDSFVDQVKVANALPPTSDFGSAIFPATYIDVSKFRKFAFVFLLGGTNRTSINFQVVQATAAAGTNSKNVTGATLTTALGASDDDTISAIECGTDKLDINNGFHFVAIQPTVSGGTSGSGAALFAGLGARTMAEDQIAAFEQYTKL